MYTKEVHEHEVIYYQVILEDKVSGATEEFELSADSLVDALLLASKFTNLQRWDIRSIRPWEFVR